MAIMVAATLRLSDVALRGIIRSALVEEVPPRGISFSAKRNPIFPKQLSL
jgi:hypothetical protein